jgi:hypothetical protein
MEQELSVFESVWPDITRQSHWEWESALSGIVAVRCGHEALLVVVLRDTAGP